MLESCYCGRTGEIEGREPVVDDEGRQALRCPDCGHLDHLSLAPRGKRPWPDVRGGGGESYAERGFDRGLNCAHTSCKGREGKGTQTMKQTTNRSAGALAREARLGTG